MALIKCSECGREISDKADMCPNCGYPIKNIKNKNNSIIKKKNYVIGFIFLAIIFIVGIGTLLLTTKNLRQYQKAKVAYENKNYTVAREIFQNLGDYKDSEERYLKSEEMYQISNDKTPPVISGIPQNLVVKVGQEFDIETWICEQGVSAYDNISGTTDIVVDKSGFDINVPGTYEIELSTQDEVGNLEKELISIVVKDYPTHEAYLQAVNISESNISITATGSGEYEGIHISQDEIGRLEDGSVYRSIAKQLEGFYVLGEDFYGNWGNDIVPIVFGFEKKSTWKEMCPYIDEAMLIISRKPTLGYILSRISKCASTEGKFNFVEGEFDFTINNLTKLSEELNITERMLGYILADLEEYAPTTEFTGNSYKCSLKFVGKRGCDISDYISYEKFENEKNQLNEIKKMTSYGGYRYYYSGVLDELLDCGEYIYGFYTNRGIQLSQSPEAVIFSHSGGELKHFDKSNDIIYETTKNSGDKNYKVLDSCENFIVYTIENTGNIVYYFNAADELIFIVYTDIIVY